MLQEKALDDIVDKFYILSSSIVKNIIASFRSTGTRRGEIDHLLAIKKQAKIEFIHDNIFPR